ncbi:hypothetical protein [Streptomyces sp. NPDC005799]|uniref:hypothetical protein n=1 Tax=Streptomyces sp. NPDC005799 TaxID=3154678 RepID=UPI0033C82632
MKNFLSVNALAAAFIVGGVILSTSGTAVAEGGLPSKARVVGEVQQTSHYINGRPFPAENLIADARAGAEELAQKQCASGQIRYKHVEIVKQNYQNDKAKQTQIVEVEISTRCW